MYGMSHFVVLAAHVGKTLMAFAMIMLAFGVAVGAEQVASSPNLQCPSCRGKDYAPTPGQFNFFFLVRYAQAVSSYLARPPSAMPHTPHR